jgi:hypothetical protein
LPTSSESQTAGAVSDAIAGHGKALSDYVAALKAEPRLVYTRYAMKLAHRAAEEEGDIWHARRLVRAVKWILAQPRRDPIETIEAIEKFLALPAGSHTSMGTLTGWPTQPETKGS